MAFPRRAHDPRHGREDLRHRDEDRRVRDRHGRCAYSQGVQEVREMEDAGERETRERRTGTHTKIKDADDASRSAS